MSKHCVDTCFESLNWLLHKLVSYDQHANWMMKPIIRLDRAMSEVEVDNADFVTNFMGFLRIF